MKWFDILLIVITFSTTIAGILANICVLAVLLKNKLTPFSLYILNLSVTDISVCVTNLVFSGLIPVLGRWCFGDIVCTIFIYEQSFFFYDSLWTPTLMAFDRFWSIMWPVHYRDNKSMKSTKILISIKFIVPFICSLIVFVPFYLYSNHNGATCFYGENVSKSVRFVSEGICICSPVIIMTLLYMRILFGIKKKTSHIKPKPQLLTNDSSSNQTSESLSNKPKKATASKDKTAEKIVLEIISIFLIADIPYSTVIFLMYFAPNLPYLDIIFKIVLFGVYFTSICNPILYLVNYYKVSEFWVWLKSKK